MSTEVDISNLALAHIGDRANIASLTEASAQAAHCKRFYPIARDTVLSSGVAWSFATKRSVMAALTLDVDSWDYKYSLPSDQLRLLVVLPADAPQDHTGVPFIVENGAVYTNEITATARYVYKQYSVGVYPSLVVLAMARLLASYLAGPMIKGREGRAVSADQYKNYLLELAMAATHDANASEHHITYVPSNIAARGSSLPQHLIVSPNDPR